MKPGGPAVAGFVGAGSSGTSVTGRCTIAGSGRSGDTSKSAMTTSGAAELVTTSGRSSVETAGGVSTSAAIGRAGGSGLFGGGTSLAAACATAAPSSSGSRGSFSRRGRRFAAVAGSASTATSGHAFLSASAKASAVSYRSAGFSASARANTSRSARGSVPAMSPRRSAARDPRPLTRLPHISSCIKAARLNTSARRSHSPPAIRSGAVYGRRTGATTPMRSSAWVRPMPVSRVSSDDRSRSRGCNAPCVIWTAAAKSSAPASCVATRSTLPAGAGPYSRTARSSESAAT